MTTVAELLADGWTTAVNYETGERKPLADIADRITGTRYATSYELRLDSIDDHEDVVIGGERPADPPKGVAPGWGCRSGGGGPVEWILDVHPWALPVELHPNYGQPITWPAPPVDGSRAAYEAAAAAAGITPQTDEEITSYGMRYGDFSFSQDPTGAVRIRQWLGHRRRDQLDAERLAAAGVRRHAADEAFTARVAAGQTYVCTRCKRPLRDWEAMAANLGTSCPDCYDELSE